MPRSATARKAQPPSLKLLPFTSNEIFELLPREIYIDRTKLNVRPWTSEYGDPEQRQQELENLALAIEAIGQKVPVLLTRYGQLIDGIHRVDSIALINHRRNVNGEPLLRVRCCIDPTEGDLWRKALLANLHSNPQSPMDMMANISTLRVQLKRDHPDWTRRQGTKWISEYISKDTQTVENWEKLHSADVELQRQIGSARISIEMALLVIKATADSEEQKQLLELCRVKQCQIMTEQALEVCARNPAREREAERRLVSIDDANVRIESPAVRQAVREFKSKKPKPRVSLTRSEFLDELAQLGNDCHASGKYFLDYLPDFVRARDSEELRKRFLAINNLGIN